MQAFMLLMDDCDGDSEVFSQRNRHITDYLAVVPALRNGTGTKLQRFTDGLFVGSQSTGKDTLTKLQLLEVVLDVSVDLSGIHGCTRVQGTPCAVTFHDTAAFESAKQAIVSGTSSLQRWVFDTEGPISHDELNELDAEVEGFWGTLSTMMHGINEAIERSNKRKVARYGTGKGQPKGLKRPVAMGTVQKIQQLLLLTHTIRR